MPTKPQRRSSASYALGLMAVLTIALQLPTVYDPSSFMTDFRVPSAEAARTIAFFLILINGFDLLGAVQDNWAVYYYSAAARVVGVAVFWSFGPVWRSWLGIEVGTLAVLVGAMVWG